MNTLYVALQFAFTAIEESVISGNSSFANVALWTRIWVNIPRYDDSRELKVSLNGRVVFQFRGKEVFSPWPRIKMADSVFELFHSKSRCRASETCGIDLETIVVCSPPDYITSRSDDIHMLV